MATKDDDPGGGESWGVPADGGLDGSDATLGRPGRHHWRQSTITDPRLDARGGVFFAAVEMTRMPMILTDPRKDDNPIVFANNAFLDLTGYEPEEIIGRNCRFLQGPGSDRDAVREMREAVAARRAVSIEILNYRRDGSPFWNAVFMGPVYDPEGELLFFFASQLDVSRRRESEQQFRQAQKMEAIGQLTAGLAHDFNNLLHVVSGSLERISTRLDDPAAVQRYLRAAGTAAERGAKLTAQLLAFARRSRLTPRAVDVSDLVSSISELLESSAGSRVELDLHLRRRLPPVQVDPVHLEMALINIVVNARDASPEGGRITVRTSCEKVVPGGALEPGEYVVLSVQDEGSGMPDHVKARAIEPFFTTKGPGEGTGLGLAMAHGFAQQSGGDLRIESEAERGATISLRFPAAKAVFEPLDPAAEGGFRAAPVDSANAPLILVVEDAPEISALAREQLEEAGYRVEVSHSGEDALARFGGTLADGGFSLVFTDVVMPGGMNGIVLAQKVREISPPTPVLLTTGYNDEMALEGPRADAMDVLGKPYRRSELLDRVQSALRRGVRMEPDRETSDFGVATA